MFGPMLAMFADSCTIGMFPIYGVTVFDLTGPDTGRCATLASDLATIGYVEAPERTEVTSPEAAHAVLSDYLRPMDMREVCYLLALDTKHRLLAVDIVSIGTVDHTFMSPRDIYGMALRHGASAIIVAHNHPSGDPEPSKDDIAVTHRLHEAGKILGVSLLDHLVIGGSAWVSCARRGLII